MGRKANTKIKLPLEIPADTYQKLAVVSAAEGKSVLDFVIEKLHRDYGTPLVPAVTTAPLPFPPPASQPLTAAPAPVTTAAAPVEAPTAKPEAHARKR